MPGCRKVAWMLLLLLGEGVFCSTCSTVLKSDGCAVRGSSAVIYCSCFHSDRNKVNSFTWSYVKSQKRRQILGSDFRKVSGRYEYIGDRGQNCSMRILHVRHADAGLYVLMVNNKTGKPSKVVKLKVVDLNILVSNSNGEGMIKEGDSVTLSCINSCDGDKPSSAFSWFKNKELINEGNVLDLRNISASNSGNYSCSLKTHTGTSSGVRLVDVEYGPRNTSLVVGSPAAVGAGRSITLTCSSDARPSVLNYTWFKAADGQMMEVGRQPVLLPDDGGQYLCSATNRHGSQNSTVFTLKVKSQRETFARDVLLIATVAVILAVITVTAVCWLINKRMRGPEAECEEETQENEDYVSWHMCDGGQLRDESKGGGEAEVVYATITFHKKRESDTERQDSEKETVIYSTVCRSQLLNSSRSKPS